MRTRSARAGSRETRPVVILALEMARTKKVERPWKKHGVMPV
jgi:acetyl-CoA carboxylase carboxyltransferase component